MEELVLAYHPGAGYGAGRLVDRLTLRMGEDAIRVAHPDDHSGPAGLDALLAQAAGLVVVVPTPVGADQPQFHAHVHLAMSVALRRSLPILIVQLLDGSGDHAELDDSIQHGTGPSIIHFDLDHLDESSVSLFNHLTNWLSVRSSRFVPRIELRSTGLESTMLPAFVGITETLPTDQPGEEFVPRCVVGWKQYEALYGGFSSGALLPRSVLGWFQNGGGPCYIAPIDAEWDAESSEPRIPGAGQVLQQAYLGSEAEHLGIAGLHGYDEVTALILPDLTNVCTTVDGSIDLDAWKAIQLAAISDAERHHRMALLDPPPGLTPQQVREWRTDHAMYDTPNACLHYPWILVDDPSGFSPEPTPFPPSGHIAGIWARTDRHRGVWRTPANQVIVGALGTPRAHGWVGLTATERQLLAPLGINPIRLLGSDGIRIWGSRTLSADLARSSLEDTRLHLALLRACSSGLRWAEFEPNTAATRLAVTRQLEEFLSRLWRAGAIAGETQSEAFMVDFDDDEPSDRIRVIVGINTVGGHLIQLGFGRGFGDMGGVVG